MNGWALQRDQRSGGCGFMHGPMRIGAAWCVSLTVLVACLTPIPLLAATPGTLVGPDLQPRRVQIQSIDNGVVTYFDAQRVFRSESLEKLVLLRDLGDGGAAATDATVPPAAGGGAVVTAVAGTQPATQPGGGRVELIDGQSFGGRFVAGAADGQAFTWSNPWLGRITIRLEQLRAMTFAGAPLEESESGEDVVALLRGDRLEGFVAGLKPAGVEIKPRGGGPAPTAPIERVRALRLANAASAGAAIGGDGKAAAPLVALGDGSRLALRHFSLVNDELVASFALAGQAQSVRLPASSVRQIDLHLAAGRLVPLADLPRSVAGGLVFGEPFPPRLRRDDAWLHAPVTLRIALPAGARRFTATAAVDTESPDAAGSSAAAAGAAAAGRVSPWVDMELVVRVDDRIVDQRRFSAQSPTATLSLPAEGKSLVIELREGLNGPVLDRLRLSRAAVLVAGAPEPTPGGR